MFLSSLFRCHSNRLFFTVIQCNAVQLSTKNPALGGQESESVRWTPRTREMVLPGLTWLHFCCLKSGNDIKTVPTKDGRGSECLPPQHVGGRGRMSRSSRPPSTCCKFTASLGYMRACPNIPEKTNPLRCTCAVSALGTLRWESCKFKASLGYTVKPCFPKQTPNRISQWGKQAPHTKQDGHPKNVTGGDLHHPYLF